MDSPKDVPLKIKKGRRTLSSTPSCLTQIGKFLVLAEAPLVIDDRPGLFFVDRGRDQRHHAGSRTAVLDHPEQLAVFPLLVELAVREVPRTWIQDRTGRTIALAFLAMAIEAGTFPFK